MACTNEKLEEFSLEHFTFINQFFGDETVREVIAEVFPNKKYIMTTQLVLLKLKYLMN